MKDSFKFDLQLFGEFDDYPTGGDEPGYGDNDDYSGTDDGGQGGGQPERYFTQADVNRIVTGRLSKQEQKYLQQIQELQGQIGQRDYPEDDGEAEDIDPLDQRLRPMEEFLEDQQLSKAVDSVCSKYPGAKADFEQNEAEIFQTALEYGIEDVELAYRQWKFDQIYSSAPQQQQPQIDPAQVKKEGVNEYLAQKRQQAASAPTPEAKGGQPPTSAKKITSFDDARKAAMNRFK